MVEIIRLSQKAKDQLIWLKRQTGIKNWNVLCRWAFCLSLADEKSLEQVDATADSNIEMSWKTFSGKYGEIYRAMLEAWRQKDKSGCTDDLAECARKHIHRGIQRMMLDKNQSIISLVQKAVYP